MIIENTRFGTIEVEDDCVIAFPNGLVGFPDQTRFVLLGRGQNRMVGYLQSLVTPSLAFPVTDGSAFDGYPEPSTVELARGAGLQASEVALLVIVAVKPGSKTLEANLLAPIVVDVDTRMGAQVVLDPRKFGASVPLVAAPTPPAPAPAPEALGDAMSEAQRRIRAIKAGKAVKVAPTKVAAVG